MSDPDRFLLVAPPRMLVQAGAAEGLTGASALAAIVGAILQRDEVETSGARFSHLPLFTDDDLAERARADEPDVKVLRVPGWGWFGYLMRQVAADGIMLVSFDPEPGRVVTYPIAAVLAAIDRATLSVPVYLTAEPRGSR